MDNSKSIPKASYATINEIITMVIESAPESEQFKIGTVAEQITYLTEYSSDKEALKAVAGEIVYNNRDTYLSDILYEVVEAVRKENTNMYTRLLVIADGADNKTIGYTYDEVIKFLGTQGVPVCTAVMPFGVLEEIQEEPQTVEEKTEEKTLPVIGKKETEPEPMKKTFHPQWIVLLLIPVAAIVVIISVVVVIKKKNDKKSETASEDEPVIEAEKLASVLPPPKAYIILKCNELPEQIYKAPINDVIYIGRKETDIIIDDHYVSSKHCEIILRGELLYVKDCNSSNGTFYENIRIYEETPIISGGNLKIGQYTYNVRLEMNHSIPK